MVALPTPSGAQAPVRTAMMTITTTFQVDATGDPIQFYPACNKAVSFFGRTWTDQWPPVPPVIYPGHGPTQVPFEFTANARCTLNVFSYGKATIKVNGQQLELAGTSVRISVDGDVNIEITDQGATKKAGDVYRGALLLDVESYLVKADDNDTVALSTPACTNTVDLVKLQAQTRTNRRNFDSVYASNATSASCRFTITSPTGADLSQRLVVYYNGKLATTTGSTGEQSFDGPLIKNNFIFAILRPATPVALIDPGPVTTTSTRPPRTTRPRSNSTVTTPPAAGGTPAVVPGTPPALSGPFVPGALLAPDSPAVATHTVDGVQVAECWDWIPNVFTGALTDPIFPRKVLQPVFDGIKPTLLATPEFGGSNFYLDPTEVRFDGDTLKDRNETFDIQRTLIGNVIGNRIVLAFTGDLDSHARAVAAATKSPQYFTVCPARATDAELRKLYDDVSAAVKEVAPSASKKQRVGNGAIPPFLVYRDPDAVYLVSNASKIEKVKELYTKFGPRGMQVYLGNVRYPDGKADETICPATVPVVTSSSAYRVTSYTWNPRSDGTETRGVLKWDVLKNTKLPSARFVKMLTRAGEPKPVAVFTDWLNPNTFRRGGEGTFDSFFSADLCVATPNYELVPGTYDVTILILLAKGTKSVPGSYLVHKQAITVS